MKMPTPPPPVDKILAGLQKDPHRMIQIFTTYASNIGAQPYYPWDKLRRLTPPEGLTHHEWWAAIKVSRIGMQRRLPLVDKQEISFTYAVTDEILKGIEEVNRNASGQISISEQVTNPSTRDRHIVNSLMEEAITSSQLEGATTTRRDAKEMIRTGRKPRTRGEQMILNNYRAMQRIREVQSQPLTIDLILEIHWILTDNAIDNPDASGRFQRPDEERIGAYSEQTDELLHEPPSAEQLPQRVQRLCDFANGILDDTYVPSVLRALIVHFMLAYEHPFEDGNGRTARALFYWSMLNQGYWLAEFISISRIIKNAPAQYGRSFLYSEQDENDLTYFLTHQLSVTQRAINDLHEYLKRKIFELRDLQRSLASMPGEFNHRQLAILENAIKNPGARYTVVSHGTSHDVARETARKDLVQLQERGLLIRRKTGREYAWTPQVDLITKLGSQ